MARVKKVENSRKPHVCGRGGHEIPKGDPYLTASPGYRGRPKYRCVQHPFRPSELTTGAASEPLSAVESFEDAAAQGFDSIEDLQQAWDELKSAVEEYQQMREQALEAWENGNSQLEELLDTAQTALDEVEGHQIEEWTGDDEPQRGDYPDDEDGLSEWEEAHAVWEQEYGEHVLEQTDEALSVVGGVEF